MTYKQALYFVGHCLSLAKYPERKNEIAKQITSDDIDWDLIVKLSSNQMVVPALYLNLKRAELLDLLPKGLELYFEEITQANTARNQALLKQVNHLATLLEKHQIKTLFLKGTAHLIAGLYQDVGERMIGDIDFLVPQGQVQSVAKILIESGYTIFEKSIISEKCRHFKRLINNDYIAAVEIHKEIIGKNHKHSLNYESLIVNKQNISSFKLPSYEHQAIYNMLNTQVNDDSFYKGSLLVRQLYDCFLLSFEKGVPEAFKLYKYDYFLKNIYLKWVHKLFKTEVKLYKKSLFLNFLMLRYEFTANKNLYRIEKTLTYYSYRIYNYPRQVVLVIKNKNKRHNILKNIQSKGWLKRHIQSYKRKTN